MKIRWKYIQDETADGIEVIVRAKERDRDVERILGLLGEEADDVIMGKTLTDEDAVPFGDVVLISKDGRYLSVKTTSGEYLLKEPLYKIEERLDPDRFVKISQSEIVNLDHVARWDFGGGGIIMVEMTNGIRTYTSRRYTTEIRKILQKGGKRG